MGTDNRRVAAYLPKEIDDRLKEFISERGLKGDSPALIIILSEFFGVAHSTAQQVGYSGFVRIEQFQELADKVSELAERIEGGSSDDELLGRLPNKMRQIAERLEKVEASAMLLPSVEANLVPDSASTTDPGQMDFLDVVQGGSPSDLKDDSPKSDSYGEPESEPPSDEKWMSTKECWEYLGRPGSYDTFRKASPEKLYQLYGITADLKRKAEGKYSAKWLSPSISSTASDQVNQENQGDSPVGLSEPPI